MVDAHALGACAFGRVGSNPTSPTTVYCKRYRDPASYLLGVPAGYEAVVGHGDDGPAGEQLRSNSCRA